MQSGPIFPMSPMGRPMSSVSPSASPLLVPVLAISETRSSAANIRARKNRLSTPCGASSRLIICRIRSVGLGAEVLHLPSLPCCFSLLTAAPHGVTPSFILSEATGARGVPSLGSFYGLYYTREYPVLTFNVAPCNTYFTERSAPTHQNIRFIFLTLSSPHTEHARNPASKAYSASMRGLRLSTGSLTRPVSRESPRRSRPPVRGL